MAVQEATEAVGRTVEDQGHPHADLSGHELIMVTGSIILETDGNSCTGGLRRRNLVEVYGLDIRCTTLMATRRITDRPI
jgi:hypothetical protein